MTRFSSPVGSRRARQGSRQWAVTTALARRQAVDDATRRLGGIITRAAVQSKEENEDYNAISVIGLQLSWHGSVEGTEQAVAALREYTSRLEVRDRSKYLGEAAIAGVAAPVSRGARDGARVRRVGSVGRLRRDPARVCERAFGRDEGDRRSA